MISTEATIKSRFSPAKRRGSKDLKKPKCFFFGTNADYLFYRDKPGDGMDWSFFKKNIVPLMAPRGAQPGFSRATAQRLEACHIGSSIACHGYKIAAIPKSFYDLLLFCFVHQDRIKQDAVRADWKYWPYGGQRADNLLVEGLPCLTLLPELEAITRRTKRKNESIEAALKRSLEAWEQNSETHVIFHAFNQRALSFLEQNNLDVEGLDQVSCLEVARDLLGQTKQQLLPNYVSATYNTFMLRYLDSLDEWFPSDENMCLQAIAHEFNAPSDAYSIYRSGEPQDSRITDAKTAWSLSFGATPLAGFMNDRLSGSPVSPAYKDRSFYVLDVQIKATQSPTDLPFIHAPPVWGIGRMASSGEFLHPRVMTPHLNDEPFAKRALFRGIAAFITSLPVNSIMFAQLDVPKDQALVRVQELIERRTWLKKPRES